jgi:precorrin-2 dehydrogenase/sirohydrochlorin ferrochelatase
MRYYPVYLDLQERTVLVVGGGAIAEGKALQLIDAGARVRVVSPRLSAKLSEMAERGSIEHREGEFTEGDLNGVTLVICATNEKDVNEEVSRLAVGRGLLCNVVDQPALCNFITPALVSRGGLQISISSGGGSPSLTQRVKREIGELIGEEYGELLELAAEMRRNAKQSISDFDDRRKVLHAFVESDALDLIRADQKEKARQIACELLEKK